MRSPLLSLLLVACSCSGQEPKPASPPPPAAAPADLVLVTLDTTRADRLGAYGHDTAGTDWIDDKARKGLRFDRAYSVLPLTIPSHASIHTGLYPFHHGIRSNGDAVLRQQQVTLAERLRDRGYRTCASVAAFVTSRDWGFDQGFQVFNDRLPDSSDRSAWHQERPAEAVIDDALGCLEQLSDDQPLFLWVHLYDAHFPYAPPQPYLQRYGERPYDGELAYIDDQLQRLDQGLQDRGRQPLWALVGDHGEALGEHHELTHGLFLYDSTQRVPLILSGPGVDVGVVEQPVSQVDLVPTLLQHLGLPQPQGLDGRPQPGAPHPVYMESWQLTERYGYAPQLAVVDSANKLIDKPRPELYDLVQDPAEAHDLAASQGPLLAELQQQLAALDPAPPARAAEPLDPVAIARLQALGYLAGGDLDVDADSLPDPLDHLDTIARMQKVEVWLQSGEPERARATLEAVMAEEPQLASVPLRLGRLLERLGERDRALAVVEEGLEYSPDDTALLLAAATLHGRRGEHERSLALARRVLELDPDEPKAAEFVVGALAELGRVPELLAFAEDFLATTPEATNVAGLVGSLHFDAGNYEAAGPLLAQAAEASRPRAGVCRKLAHIAQARGRTDEARRLLERELELHPDQPAALVQLGSLAATQGRDAEVVDLLDRALAAGTAPTPGLHQARATSLLNLQQLDAALAAVQAGLELAPNDPDLVLLLANIQLQQGDRETAEATHARAMALDAARGASETSPQ